MIIVKDFHGGDLMIQKSFHLKTGSNLIEIEFDWDVCQDGHSYKHLSLENAVKLRDEISKLIEELSK